MADEFGYQGAQEPNDNQGDFNALSFICSQLISRLNVSTVVRVVAVADEGETDVAIAGRVDVQPLVNQLDGALNAIPHGTLYSLPYMRIQGGKNAFVIVPQVGDLGVALFADRDISSVVAAMDQANPGSLRRFDMADGMYLGGMLNALPIRYVHISDQGVTIQGDTKVTIKADAIQIDGDLTLNGALHVTGAVTADDDIDVSGDANVGGTVDADGDVKTNGVSLHNHKHIGTQPGSGLSGIPLVI